jgi:hypothetical protein
MEEGEVITVVAAEWDYRGMEEGMRAVPNVSKLCSQGNLRACTFARPAEGEKNTA